MEILKYFFKEYPQRTIFVAISVTVASLISALTLTALPVLLGLMLGKDTAKGKAFLQFFEQLGFNPTTKSLLLFIIIGLLAQNIILSASKIYAGFTLAKIVKSLRIKLLTAISKSEWYYFIKQKTGKITASVMNQAEIAGQSYITSIEILASIVQVIAYLSVAFIISYEIALIAIATSLILFLIFKKFITYSKQLGKENVSLSIQITSQITDNSRCIKSLKAMARESHMNALLDSYTKKLRSVSKKSTTVAESLDMLQEIFLMGAIVLTLYFSFQYLDLPLEFAIILVYIYLRTMKMFGKIQRQLQQFAVNANCYEQVLKYISVAQEYREDRTGTLQHSLTGNIRLENVCFSYNEKQILNNASATIFHNKINSIVGSSGAGKTTLVDLVCGLYMPTAGEIFVDNVPLSGIDIRHWRKQIGYVVQEVTLLNSSIRENITLGDTSISDQQVRLALHKAHAESFVNSLPDGIDTITGESGAKMSGGQRQRILIARALVHSPRLLILDEATSALDSKTELLLSEVFKELSEDITIISISHRPAMVEISDQVIELSNGKLNVMKSAA